MEITVVNEEFESRFVARNEKNQVVGEVHYINRPAYLDVYHTEVLPEFEGLGVASKMMRQTLEILQKSNRKVYPRCPYAANFLSKHPEYDGLIYR